jgi:hypothetical protein
MLLPGATRKIRIVLRQRMAVGFGNLRGTSERKTSSPLSLEETRTCPEAIAILAAFNPDSCAFKRSSLAI